MNHWKEDLAQVKQAIENSGGEVLDFEIAAPATEQAMTDVELALGFSLPQKFREVLTNFSSRLKLCWFLPEDYELPEEISEIMSGELDWDLSNLVNLDQAVKRIIKTHFTDDDDPIGIIWQEKLAFHETGNGDFLAIDISNEDYGKVVYLSHEADDSHGYILANDFIDYLNRVIPLGCPGPESWSWICFTENEFSGIDPDSDNAKKWKQILYKKSETVEAPKEKAETKPKVDPKLLAVENDLVKLLDFCMRKRDIKPDMVDSLNKHPHREILDELIRRMSKNKSVNKEYMAYSICRDVLKTDAAEWIRERLESYDSKQYEWDDNPLDELVRASAECLQIEEAHRLVTGIIQEQGFGKMETRFRNLAWLQSPLTLDWIEQHVHKEKSISDSWGRVAANSCFTWERAVKWLNSGRPLSLVALDAIVLSYFKDSIQTRMINSTLLNAPSKEEIVKTMQAYYLNDKVPRVRKAIEQLERHYK